jgi:hypothetical protein
MTTFSHPVIITNPNFGRFTSILGQVVIVNQIEKVKVSQEQNNSGK